MSSDSIEKKWMLEKYSKQESGFWKEVNIDKHYCYLELFYPQLVIIDRGVAIDSVDLSIGAENIKIGYFKSEIGIKTTCKDGKISTIRLTLASGNGNKSGSDYCAEVVNVLKRYAPVNPHQFPVERNPMGIVKQELNEIMKGLLLETSSRHNSADVESVIPENGIKLILDEFVFHPQFQTKIFEIWELSLNLKKKKSKIILQDLSDLQLSLRRRGYLF